MRRDGNHTAIERALRAVGISVVDTHEIGSGVPDLLWGSRQVTGLMEIKLPGEELEPHQADWHQSWRGGRVLVARTPEEAIRLIQDAVRAQR